MPCPSCGRVICLVFGHKERLLGELDSIDVTLNASKKRNHLYPSFVMSEYGKLGACNRVQIPDCIVSYIRSICPSSDGQYTGYRASRDDKNDGCTGVDVRNEDSVGMSGEEEHEKYGKKKEDGEVTDDSYIVIENQCNKSVDFAGGEQMKLSMHFNHP